MAQLNLGAIKDIGGIGGFTFTSGGITANGTLNVQDIEISGTLAGSSAYILPNPSGHTDEYISTNGSALTWGTLSSASGVRSMQVWTGNGTWYKPSDVKTIMVTVTGAGGGLGKQHALEFARRGAKVVVNDLGGAVDGSGGASDAANAVVEEIKAEGGEAISNGSSVADKAGVSKMIEETMEKCCLLYTSPSPRD